MNASTLDTTFGGTGKVTTPITLGVDNATAVAIQPDAKIVVAGTALVRYNSDGTLDMNFGSFGRVLTDVGTAVGVVVQASDGKIIVAGDASMLVRYNADGTLDTNYGTNGHVTIDFGGTNAMLTGVALAAGDQVIVSGSTVLQPPPSPQSNAAVLERFNLDGTLDTTFGTNGKATDASGAGAAGLVLQPDGKILVGISGNSTFSFPNDHGFAVARFNADGTADAGFSGVVDFGAGNNVPRNLAVQPDLKIVASGSVSGKSVLTRLNTDGSLDTAFGISGKVFADVVGHPIVQTDGKIVAIGSVIVGTKSNFAVARYNPDGSPDSNFGIAGVVTTAFDSASTGSGSGSYAENLTLQSDGKIVVVGREFLTHTSTEFAVARYLGGPSDPLSGTNNQRFVSQLYLDLLERTADASGLAYWSGLLDQGKATRMQIALGVEGSIEYRTDVVANLYRTYLGREADAAGLQQWTAFLGAGGAAERLAAYLLGTDEYQARNSVLGVGFLDALYRDVLYRSMDQAGRDYWNGVLNGGTARETIAAAVLASVESDTFETQGLYHQFLHRAPDPVGQDNFVSSLQSGMSNEVAAAVLAAAVEYLSRP